ncbi:MAG: hypothetical protein R3C49_10340 [Planctomycetaceae bacterium]
MLRLLQTVLAVLPLLPVAMNAARCEDSPPIHDIVRLNLASGETQVVVQGRSGDVFEGVAWNSSTERMAVAVQRRSDVNEEAPPRIVLHDLNRSLITEVTWGTQPNFSPRGNRLLLTRSGRERGVWLTTSDGRDQHLLDFRAARATWSGSGRYLVWIRTVDDGSQMMLSDLAEDTVRPLTLPSGFQSADIITNLAWSADSAQVTFVVRQKGEFQRVHSVFVDDRPPVDHGEIRSGAIGHISWLNDHELLATVEHQPDGWQLAGVRIPGEQSAEPALSFLRPNQFCDSAEFCLDARAEYAFLIRKHVP